MIFGLALPRPLTPLLHNAPLSKFLVNPLYRDDSANTKTDQTERRLVPQIKTKKKINKKNKTKQKKKQQLELDTRYVETVFLSLRKTIKLLKIFLRLMVKSLPVTTKSYFSFLKSCKQDQSGTPLQQGSNLVTDACEKADVYNQQFHSVYTTKEPLSLSRLCTMKLQDMADREPSLQRQHLFPKMNLLLYRILNEQSNV